MQPAERQFEFPGQRGVIQVNRHDFDFIIQGEIDFPETVRGLKRSPGDEKQESAGALDGGGNLGPPGLSGRDAFVVPEVDAFAVQRLEVSIHARRIAVRIAHKYVRFGPTIRWKRFFHPDTAADRKGSSSIPAAF